MINYKFIQVNSYFLSFYFEMQRNGKEEKCRNYQVEACKEDVGKENGSKGKSALKQEVLTEFFFSPRNIQRNGQSDL